MLDGIKKEIFTSERKLHTTDQQWEWIQRQSDIVCVRLNDSKHDYNKLINYGV